MIKVRVSAGFLKGRSITLGREYSSAEITPQKVKQALFSMIGESLEGKIFLDLYSCSGQIGIEAVSRGAEFTVINELDRYRFRSISGTVNDFGISESVRTMNFRALAAMKHLFMDGRVFDFIFADPPYEKKRGDTKFYNEIIEAAATSGILAADGVFIIQHYTGNNPSEGYGVLKLTDTRSYGTSSLSCYRMNV